MLNPAHKKTRISGLLWAVGYGPNYGAELFDGEADEIEDLANSPNGRIADTSAASAQVELKISFEALNSPAR